MNKKGTHVDWVISFGIFIVYIVALFILLKPGIRPIHRPVTLLNNLQENFENNIMWTIKMVPLFIRECSGVIEGAYSSVWIDDEKNKWGTCSSCIKDADGNLISEDFLSGDKLICAKTGFSSTHPGPFYYHFQGEGDFRFDYDFECKSTSETPEEDCKAEIGIVENIRGIKSAALNNIKTLDYNDLKTDWEVPPDKDFAIWSDTKIIGAEPYEQANVFVRRIETQKVTKKGEKTPVTIYLRIW